MLMEGYCLTIFCCNVVFGVWFKPTEKQLGILDNYDFLVKQYMTNHQCDDHLCMYCKYGPYRICLDRYDIPFLFNVRYVHKLLGPLEPYYDEYVFAEEREFYES